MEEGWIDRRSCSDKVRGFYRPPAAMMVVGRRKLLALVANDRRLGGRRASRLATPLNTLMSSIHARERERERDLFRRYALSTIARGILVATIKGE